MMCASACAVTACRRRMIAGVARVVLGDELERLRVERERVLLAPNPGRPVRRLR